MRSDDFARIVREGADKLRANKITVVDAAGVTRFTGNGMVRINSNSLEIDLALRGSAPPRSTNILTSKDYWTLTGVINDELPFRSQFITPISAHAGFKDPLKVTRTLHIVELVTKRVDPVKKRRNQRALYRRLGVTMPRRKPGNDRSFSFHAIFVDHPLPGANAGTEMVRINDFLPECRSKSADTFIGETSAGRYALIRASNKRDLHVYLQSKPDFKSASEESDQRKFHALLHALAFTSGIQPWPFRTKYSRGAGYLMSDTLRAPEPSPRTVFAPFRQAYETEAAAWLARAIRVAADFLEPDTRFTRKLLHLLFLFRQAGSDGVQTEITILTVCTLLESLVRAIFKHICGQQSAALGVLDTRRFENLRGSFLKCVSGIAESKKGPEYQRLYKRISNAQMFEVQDMFKAVAQRLTLSWEDDMEPIFREWKKARNPSAHGDFRHDVDNEVQHQVAEETFLGLSRVAGGFNMILLKLFGYEGPYLASIIEGEYGQMKEL